MSEGRASGAAREWQALSSAEVVGAVALDPVVVLPLAAIEQHGPHLPLSTDLDIGLGLLANAFSRLPADFPCWALPALPVGASSEHASFAGTLSVSAEALVQVVVAIGASLARSGVRRLLLSNSHGGNKAALEDAGLRLRREHGLLVVKTSWFRFERPPEVDLPEREWRHGLHGGAVETAMMLHLRPDLVRAEAIADFPSLAADLDGTMRRLSHEGEASFSWLAEDLGPQGVAGDATLASAEMGRRLVQHYGHAIAESIQDARAFPIEQLAGPA